MSSPAQLQSLAEIFRGNPPDQPNRFYRLTREGRWLRSSGDRFVKVKGRRVSGKVLRPEIDGR